MIPKKYDFKALTLLAFENIEKILPWRWSPVHSGGSCKVRRCMERRHLYNTQAKDLGDIYITEHGKLKEYGGRTECDLYDYVASVNNEGRKEAVKRIAEAVGYQNDTKMIPNDTKMIPRQNASSLPLQSVPRPTPRYIEEAHPQWIDQSVAHNLDSPNTLSAYLLETFQGNRKEVYETLINYFVGTTRDNRTLFWYLDEYGRQVDAKGIHYRDDGHRDKSKPIAYYHSRLRKRPDHPEDVSDTTRPFDAGTRADLPLYGAHLLANRQGVSVIIVESEKSALIGSIWSRTQASIEDQIRFVWLATGGKGTLTAPRLAGLQGREVLLIPDRDATDEWRAEARKLAECGIMAKLVPMMKLAECYGIDIEERGKGYDIADLMTELAARPTPTATPISTAIEQASEDLTRAIQINPFLLDLITRLDLHEER